MTKRYTKRAYKKRRTLRKLRVKHRNTQRGGGYLEDMKAQANKLAAAGQAKLNEATAAAKAKFDEVAASSPEMITKIAAAKAQARKLAAATEAKFSEATAAAEAQANKLTAANPAMMATLAAAEAQASELAAAAKAQASELAVAAKAQANKATAAAKAQANKLAAANPKLKAEFNNISTQVSGLIADGKAMVANGTPNAATVLTKTSLGPLTKTSLGPLNAFVALAKTMYSLMDMINIAKYYTSNTAFALAQLKEKTSEIKTNLRDTYSDIDTCITALQTAIESATPQTSPPELIPPESFNEKLKRLHNDISIDGVFKTINRDISAINAAMIAMNDMSKKPENQGWIGCFNVMKDKVLATVEDKKATISYGITKLRTANPKKTFSVSLKAIWSNMGSGIERAREASVQAQAAVGQGIGQLKAARAQGMEQLQTATQQASQQASQQVSAAMSSIKSGPSQAATAALDEVKKAAEEYAAKTQTAHQVAKEALAKTTTHINKNESDLSKGLGLTWQMEKNQYNIRKIFQTQIVNAANTYKYNAETLLDKANTAAVPKLSNEERKAALIELNNAAETNVVTTANLLKTATKLKDDSITAKNSGPGFLSANKEGIEFELNQNMIKSGNHFKEANANVATVQAIKAKVAAAAAAAAGVTI